MAPHDPRRRFLCFFIVLSRALLVRRLSQGYYVCSDCPSFSAPLRQGPTHTYLHRYLSLRIFHIKISLTSYMYVYVLYIPCLDIYMSSGCLSCPAPLRRGLAHIYFITHLDILDPIFHNIYSTFKPSPSALLHSASPEAGCSIYYVLLVQSFMAFTTNDGNM